MPYLLRRDGVYYFRLKVPKDLRGFFSFREIKKSLGTRHFRNAKILAVGLSFKAEKLFTLIRSGMLTDEEIKQLVAEYIHESLKTDEDFRALHSSPIDDNLLDKLHYAYQATLEEVTKDLATSNTAAAAPHVDDFLNRHSDDLKKKGIVIEQDSPEYKKLCHGFLKAQVTFFKAGLERYKGNYENGYDSVYNTVLTPPSAVVTSTLSQAEPKGKRLSEAFEEYRNKQKLTAWKRPKTERGHLSTFALFREVLKVVTGEDDIELKAVDKATMLKCASVIAGLPKNLNKMPAYRGKPLDEVIRICAANPGERIHNKTYNNKMGFIISLFAWAVKQGYIERNFGEDLRKEDTRSPEEAREVYNREDLERLFSSPVYNNPKKDKPERFWIPLVALFAGMRLTEVCQLYTEDVTVIEGVPCFNIREDGKEDKFLKTGGSVRIVPVHPELIALGFLRYVKRMEAEGQSRLWPNVKMGRDSYGDLFGKWYQRYNRLYVTSNKKKVFHSFRHTFADTLKQSEVIEPVAAALVGHSNSKSVTFGRYGKKYKPAVLLEAMKKLDFGIDLSHPKEKAPV